MVSAPQLSLDPGEIVAVHPPTGSTGQYANELPHVVIAEPMLPWERSLPGGAAGQPWLALLVLDPDEVVDPAGSATGAIDTTVGEFRAAGDGTTIKPKFTLDDDVGEGDPMAMVVVPVATFAAVAPRPEELPFLAHCRQANTADKATLGIDEHGLFSVVVGNRFPETPASTSAAPLKSVVHLVSLEGLEPYLVPGADFGSAANVALASLASWSFWTVAEPQEDFRGLMDAIAAAGATPDRYRLRLSSSGVNGSAPGGAEAAERLDQGFVPLPYLTRSAESTLGWYRGPLTPFPVASLDRAEPFLTADAALGYQSKYGVFDASLAAAFQIGRAAALADSNFGQRLLDLRRRGHRFTDALHHRLESDAFGSSEIAALSGATVRDELQSVLTADLLADFGHAGPPPPPPTPPPPGPDSSPQEALAAFLASDEVQGALLEAVSVDLDPIATWLSKLLLLAPLPFHSLVPLETMLPAESLRFFHVDPNWLEAQLDGALSIGVESSRDTFFHQIVGDVLYAAAYDAVETYRSTLEGSGPAQPATGTGAMSGLLLRSAVVAGWPNLAVRPTDAAGEPVKTLRMEHLSPNVLLCLFSGTPETITIAEPQEGFRFGVDGNGDAALRSVLSGGGLEVGEQFEHDPVVHVRDLSGKTAAGMRTPGGRVLNLAPAEASGLVQQLHAGVKAAASPAAVEDFGPADLALQMIDAPEAFDFAAPKAGPA